MKSNNQRLAEAMAKTWTFTGQDKNELRTKEMIADILTKNLAKDQFCRLRDHLLGYHLNGVLMKLDLCRQKELKMYKVILKLRLLRSMRPGPIRDQLMENVEDMQ